MTAVDELREALRSASDTVPPPPDLLAGARRRMRRARRIRVCVAAGVTVGVCAASVSLMPLLKPGREAAAVAPGQPSRFFVAFTPHKGDDAAIEATVRDVGTGKVSAKVPTPAELEGWGTVDATLNSRIYYLSGWLRGNGLTRLYRLDLTTQGKVSGLTRVRDLPSIGRSQSLAVSPDGRDVALSTSAPAGGTGDARVQLVSLVGGPAQAISVPDAVEATALSWSGDGRHVAFMAGPKATGNGYIDGLYVADIGADGRPGHARRVIQDRQALGQLVRPVLSADGTRVYVTAAQGTPPWTRLLEVDVATGQQRRVLFQQRYDASKAAVWMFSRISLSLSGKALILWSNGSGHRLDLATGKDHPFAFPGQQPEALAW